MDRNKEIESQVELDWRMVCRPRRLIPPDDPALGVRSAMFVVFASLRDADVDVDVDVVLVEMLVLKLSWLRW